MTVPGKPTTPLSSTLSCPSRAGRSCGTGVQTGRCPPPDVDPRHHLHLCRRSKTLAKSHFRCPAHTPSLGRRSRSRTLSLPPRQTVTGTHTRRAHGPSRVEVFTPPAPTVSDRCVPKTPDRTTVRSLGFFWTQGRRQEPGRDWGREGRRKVLTTRHLKT